jgi:tRNA(Ile)-lysidine synthase
MPVGDDWPLECGDDATLLDFAQAAFLTDDVKKIAVAVSGGSDSMASVHLMARAAAHEGWTLHAVTVDHALRLESADEASQVAQVCGTLGVPHSVLTWAHGALKGNLMDAARQARYRLMADWALHNGISHIVLGHTADDQAETFLMGLARSAGLGGLIGMKAQFDHGELDREVRFVRPFLSVERADLRAYLRRQKLGWIDDPSNENTRYTRVKARKALAALKPLGVSVDALATVMANLREAQSVVLAATAAAEARICHTQAGEVVFDRELWRKEGREVQRRLLIAALRWISGAGYAPRGSGVARVIAAIDLGRDTTLAGCRIRVSGASFQVVRELSAAGAPCAPGQIWDGRWQVEGPFKAGQEVRGLGADGLRQCAGWKSTGHSRCSLLASPAVWDNNVLIAAPMAGFGMEFTARIVAPFNQFVLSH